MTHPEPETPDAELSLGTLEASVERSNEIAADLQKNPQKYRVLTGDRGSRRVRVFDGGGTG